MKNRLTRVGLKLQGASMALNTHEFLASCSSPRYKVPLYLELYLPLF